MTNITPERLQAIREAAKTKSMRQIMREFSIGRSTLRKHGIQTEGRCHQPTVIPLRKKRREVSVNLPADVLAWLEDTAQTVGKPVDALIASILTEVVIDTANSEAA